MAVHLLETRMAIANRYNPAKTAGKSVCCHQPQGLCSLCESLESQLCTHICSGYYNVMPMPMLCPPTTPRVRLFAMQPVQTRTDQAIPKFGRRGENTQEAAVSVMCTQTQISSCRTSVVCCIVWSLALDSLRLRCFLAMTSRLMDFATFSPSLDVDCKRQSVLSECPWTRRQF